MNKKYFTEDKMMKCITHINREAECYCSICSQPICGECRDYIGMCIPCAKKIYNADKANFMKNIIMSILVPILSFIFFSVSGINGGGLFVGVVLSIFVPFGW